MSFFAELKRRNVFRVGLAYVLMGWVLLQAADFVLDLIGAPDWVIRAFALAVAVGLPIALFFAWAFELTPEGIKRERDVDRTRSITPHTGRKLNRLIIGLLLAVIALMAVERLYFAGQGGRAAGAPEAGPAPADKSIAVLPFTDLSQAKDQAWFADGLAEEILNALVRVPDLAVAARTSSFAYKDTNQDVSTIAAELGVAHVLEGSVRSSGERIRVTAQLIRASDGFHLWSQNYDRDVADMIGIQEDLARNIALALQTSMDPEALAQMAEVGTDSVEAYQEYLRGLQQQAQILVYHAGLEEAARGAYEHFERARAIDPGFVQAHVQAANYWKVQIEPNRFETGLTRLEPRQMLNEYNARIRLAIESARSEADRIRSLADRAMVDLRLGEARALFEQYLELRPNDELARSEYESVLGMLGDTGPAARAVVAHWRARGESDEASAQWYANRAYRVVDPAEAAVFVLEAVRRWPNSDALIYQAHRTLLWAGRVSEAAELAARYQALVPGSHPLVSARQACAEGDREAAERILDGLDRKRNNYLSARWLLLNLLGRSQEEYELVSQLEASGVPYQLASFLGYPQFDPRPYPSLMAVLEREGIQRPPPVTPPFACPPPAETSVAVLPFVNMSADPDNEYFSDGVAEEILNALARIPELKVSARTSAFTYKGSDATIAQIARELGVNHVLEGSVRKAGNQVRVTAQLIRAATGFHLWSETYDRELTNIFAIQDDIARAIAAQLEVRLLPPADQPNLTGTEDLAAYQLYLQAVSHWHERSGASLERARELLERALALDPGFARARAYLALTWVILSDYTDRPRDEAQAAARREARAALAADPGGIEAATALILATEDLREQVEYARQAIALNDGFATTHQWYASTLVSLGDLHGAERAYRIAQQLDPRSRIIADNLAMLQIYMGDLEAAEQTARRTEAIAPDWAQAHQRLFQIHLLRGDRAQAERVGNLLAERLGRTRNATPQYLDMFFDADRRAAALADIAAFPLDRWDSPDNPALVDHYDSMLLVAAAGGHREALQMIEWLRQRELISSWAFMRSVRILPEFVCSAETQAYFAGTGLPPPVEPYPCP